MKTASPDTHAVPDTTGIGTSGIGAGPVLFLAIFLFFWISMTPFVDLTGENILDPSAGNSNRLNQIVSLSLFAGTLCYGLFHPLRATILQPRALLLPMFGWFLFVSLISNHPMLGIKAVVLTVMATINASIYLLMPSSEKQFAKMLAIGTLITLATAYYGVVFKPELSIPPAFGAARTDECRHVARAFPAQEQRRRRHGACLLLRGCSL